MQTVKQILEEMFLGKKVKITIGHPSNKQYIIATVLGFESNSNQPMGDDGTRGMFILLKDIIGLEADYSQSVKNMIKSGRFNRHYFRLDTEIVVLRDENLTQLLENK
jgi:hypothetical protein